MRRRTGAIGAAALLAGAFALAPATATAAVSSVPAPTPAFATSGTDGSVEQVRQIVQCGGTMYAVGRFGSMRDPVSGAAVSRANAVAFSAVSPYRITAWNPRPNGQVNTVACGPDGAILLGGSFSTAGGAANRNLAKVSSTTGGSLPFGLHPAGPVSHIEVVQGHLLVGGFFAGFLTSVSPVTGASDGYRMPTISGRYVNPDGTSAPTELHNMTPNATGTAVLMAGVFTTVGGQPHRQIFRLNMTPSAATVSAWAPAELDVSCRIPFYARDAAWSPDGTRIYTATTGAWPYGTPGTGPRTGPCDALIAWPATEQRIVGHLWINYTGCDSFYSVTADATTVYAGGHQRWVSNPNGCDYAGPGAIRQPGLAEVNPATGAHQPGPDRGRGWGAIDLLRTSAGLWVASDNAFGTTTCAGQKGHGGICFLPD